MVSKTAEAGGIGSALHRPHQEAFFAFGEIGMLFRFPSFSPKRSEADSGLGVNNRYRA